MHIGNKIWEGNILIPYMLLYPAQRLSLFLCDKFHQVGAKAKAVEERRKETPAYEGLERARKPEKVGQSFFMG